MDYQKYLANLKDQNKEASLLAATRLFCECGIENVKMTEIAELAKVGVASLYRYYETKENLVVLCGTQLWLELAKDLTPRFETEEFIKKNGYGQVEDLLSVYGYLYREKKNFVRFLWQFDSFCIQHKVEKSALGAYEESLHWSYPLFLAAYSKGIEDGSLRSDVDIKKMYITVNHALMSVLQKLLQGEIIEEDDFKNDGELQLLSHMILEYVKIIINKK